MRGLVSFHPIDLGFFDEVIAPLVVGEKLNPERFVEAALRLRASELQVEPYRRALVALLDRLAPKPAPVEGSVWTRMKAKLEQLDEKPDRLATLVASRIDRDLHLEGRPFLITEGSADHVAALVEEFRKADGRAAVESLLLEQLVRIEPSLPAELTLEEIEPPSADMAYRTDLLERLKAVHALARAAREDENWGSATERRVRARDVIGRELPWRAVELHACTSPFWIGRDVDGIETVCRAAEIDPPPSLVTGRRLFARGIEAVPELGEQLTTELRDGRDVGAFVPPGEVPLLLDFLQAEGAKIIRVATRHGEGASCANLLRKIRECAEYAAANGRGYLEASGIHPLAAAPEDEEEPPP